MSKEYNQYLQEHRANVAAAFYWMQQNMPGILIGNYDYEQQITAAHDLSKFGPEEYSAYDAYFYGSDESYAVKEIFNYAWLHHIHNNPHHWQHWILDNDDPNEGEVLMDIPYNYVIEMICDWWSFCFKQGNLYGIYDWYNAHKSYMKLSNSTRTTVSDILSRIYVKLTELEG
jgi:hypothetical protein